MKLLSFSCLLICLFVLAAVAAAPQMAVVVTYLDKNTPDWVLDQAKRAIREARGTVTHEYTIIKGFAAQAPAKALKTVKALNAKYLPVIQEDFIVSIDGDLIEGDHIN